MNGYESLKNKRSTRMISVVLVVLVLFEICSLAMLFSRLTMYVPAESANVFPLTESTIITDVKVGTLTQSGDIIFNEEAATESQIQVLSSSMPSFEIIPLDAVSDGDTSSDAPSRPPKPSFKVYDDTTVWTANTNVEIFKFSYENDECEITVAGDGKDKLIAPGTSNIYSFTLKNTGNVSMDYEMTMEAYVTGTDIKIPVVVRAYDHSGNYMVGGRDEWDDVEDLNSVKKRGTLASTRWANFSLEWMWPYEGNDAYDTLLGNLADSGDLTLTIAINTVSKESDDPNDPGDNPPQTGDKSISAVYLAAGALLIGIAVVYCGGKYRDRSRDYE